MSGLSRAGELAEMALGDTTQVPLAPGNEGPPVEGLVRRQSGEAL